MQHPELRLSAEGLVLSASAVLRTLQCLTDRFAAERISVPAELSHLRETLLTLRKLLENFCGAEETALTTLKQERAALGLRGELLLAGRLCKQLNETIHAVHGEQNDDLEQFQSKEDESLAGQVLPSTTLKFRWSFHKNQIGKVHKELCDNCSRCLGEMLLMNASISADIEPRLERSLLSETPSSTLLPHQRINHEDKMLREERLLNIQDIPSGDATKSLLLRDDSKMLRYDVEPKAPPRASYTTLRLQPTDTRRDVDHVELMLSGIATSITSSSPRTESTPRYRSRRSTESREFNRDFADQGSCTCECHTEKKTPSIWAVSAFKSALGVISLEFRGQSEVTCSECPNDCSTKPKGRSMRLIYSFPTWLFHAAVSVSFTDTLGSPEFVLRVLRRIPPDQKSLFASVFGMIARGDDEGLKRALRKKEASVLDINGVNGTGVLWTCVAMNKFEFLEILLFEGADLFQLDDNGIAPYSFLLQILYTSPRMDIATRTRLEAILPMEKMLEACQLNELHKIVIGLRHTSVQEYMRDPSRRNEANSYDVRFRTPLGFASARGDLRAVKELLEAGAVPDLEVPTRSKPRGPLASACFNGHLAVVEELLMAGADVNARNNGQTPLHHLAPCHNSLDIAACLIQHGADISAVDRFLSTPLDLASHHNNAALADFLLRNGADLNHRDWEGSNALQIAISSNACATAAVLLEHNIDYRNTDVYNHGILHYLATCGTVPMMDIMARHRMVGLEVDAPDNQGRTPLQLCRARSDSTEVLQEAFELLLASVT